MNVSLKREIAGLLVSAEVVFKMGQLLWRTVLQATKLYLSDTLWVIGIITQSQSRLTLLRVWVNDFRVKTWKCLLTVLNDWLRLLKSL